MVATVVRFTGWAFIPILQTESCVIIMAHVVAEYAAVTAAKRLDGILKCISFSILHNTLW